jgi:hypothetical protein
MSDAIFGQRFCWMPPSGYTPLQSAVLLSVSGPRLGRRFPHHLARLTFDVFSFQFLSKVLSIVSLLVNLEYRIYKSYSGTNLLFQLIENTGILHQNTC